MILWLKAIPLRGGFVHFWRILQRKSIRVSTQVGSRPRTQLTSGFQTCQKRRTDVRSLPQPPRLVNDWEKERRKVKLLSLVVAVLTAIVVILVFVSFLR